jgi:hypothetical protein
MIDEGKENVKGRVKKATKKVVFASSLAQWFEHLVALSLELISSKR